MTQFDWAQVGDEPPRLLGVRCGDLDETAAALSPAMEAGPGIPLLGEYTHGLLTRPHLRGWRIDADTDAAWSTRFRWAEAAPNEAGVAFDGVDEAAGLAMRVEFMHRPGGVLAGRATVTNLWGSRYVVDGLEVVLPVVDSCRELLDFTGRHEHERAPQRHAITDGLWLRESRGGRPGLGAATQVIVGPPAFDTINGDVVAVHVAWSGNSVLRVERDPSSAGVTVGGGELLLPGEMILAEGESYSTPDVLFVASDGGLDGVAAAWHTFQRSFDAHPAVQPVVLNVWEAVFFDHDFDRLAMIADRAARVGVERFVLDDGWFLGRRDDTAGLGDWWVDPDVWPDGLSPLIDRVERHGMEFGLWFEPEMVNPNSCLYREHPDWIVSSGGRVPRPQRYQQVLDLTRSEAWQFVFDRMHAILEDNRIRYVKWDHNRDLFDAGSSARRGRPVAHDQTIAFYQLLDALRAAHPDVAWESCASGGGRIDLGVLPRVQRVWTSDMTDALARQHLQRWATQLVAPEYLGAHVSAPTSHTTGRTLSLDFRAATALFGAFGVEWDLSTALDTELDALSDWIARFKRLRPLLHGGRTVRPPSSDPCVLLHAVVAPDASSALVAHVQLDESSHNRGVRVHVVGLDPTAMYTLAWEGPVMAQAVSASAPLPEHGPTAGVPVSGGALASTGYWIPRRRPETVTLVRVERVAG